MMDTFLLSALKFLALRIISIKIRSDEISICINNTIYQVKQNVIYGWYKQNYAL